MKQDIKSKEPQERQSYVPASLKVIEITSQGILCGSGNYPPQYPGSQWTPGL